MTPPEVGIRSSNLDAPMAAAANDRRHPAWPTFRPRDRRDLATPFDELYDRRTVFAPIAPLLNVANLPKLGLVLIALTLSWACMSGSNSNPLAFFPASNEVQNWNKAGEARTFAASQLSEYIDGDAEKYLRAGVEQTLTADYRFAGKADAVVDIFVMKTVAGAIRVFESQPAEGSESVPMADAARLYPGNLTFRQGRYFVRLVAYNDLPETQQALVALGRAIAVKLR